MMRNLALSRSCGRALSPFAEKAAPAKVALIDCEDYSGNLQRDLAVMMEDFTEAEKADVQPNLFIICDATVAGVVTRAGRLTVEDARANKPTVAGVAGIEHASTDAAAVARVGAAERCSAYERTVAGVGSVEGADGQRAACAVAAVECANTQ